MLPRIVVAGNGQLGQMLQQAGAPMQLEVLPVAPTAEGEAPLTGSDIITVEVEHWPDTPRGLQLKQHPNFLNATALHSVIDRERQKSLLDRLNVPTSPWVSLGSEAEMAEQLASLGRPAIVKRRRGGYDGRGQWRWQPGEPALSDWAGECIAEALIPFSHEVSLIGARNRAGEKVFYPLTRNWHESGILRASIANLPVPAEQQREAESWLGRIMDDQNYVGVMAMECFVDEGRLLVNELAPRVHNSGHWTQAGADVSQFELHLRAVADLPLITPEVYGVTVMYNLLGRDWRPQWLGVTGTHVHWYAKDIRPGRKVGHVNIHRPDTPRLTESLTALREQVEPDDHAVFDWVLAQL
ncbi:5-(carboxyamino)imidazole ribonucleotide synthase [Marinimicrobium sp. ARAG 43.8]|uniref:5-(carboxyamino)imidazole ribonucleotide synthase n=1 Tax=Marinimicrobium sp. ARAG 43.8 TaxID=3418719 RepID=UPI003CF4857B